MKDSITFVGLDVHKDTIDIAVADSTGSKEVRHYGKIDGDLTALDKAVRRLGKKVRLAQHLPIMRSWASHETFSPTYELL